ncbi:hypothetical protein BY996DRAFT_4603923 [Phakopsora pachyrhizi]|nr:hypothetical protein BY996DRAFT_4603923 [Phakopsora pachyrhizi]
MLLSKDECFDSYTVVILVGLGENLFPVINNDQLDRNVQPTESDSIKLSKSNLPILNRPLLDLTLDWIEQSSELRDLLILSSESQRSTLNSIIRSRRSSSDSINPLSIRLECLPHHDLLGRGTAGTLRWAIQSALIKTSFVVLPCDLYFQFNRTLSRNSNYRSSSAQLDRLYDRTLSGLVDSHRTNQNLITSVFYERDANSIGLKHDPNPNLVTLDPRSGIILNLQELDGFGSEIEIRMRMIERYPMNVMSSNLVCAHIFICSPLVMDLLVGLNQFSSFKDQFVPWLIKNQWQPGLLEKSLTNSTKKLNILQDPQNLALQSSTTNPNPLARSNNPTRRGIRTPLTANSTPLTISRNFSYISLDDQPRALTPILYPKNPQTGSGDVSLRDVGTGLRCDYVIWKSSDGFVCRANSVNGYGEINRKALKIDFEDRNRNNNNRRNVILNKTEDGGTWSNDSVVNSRGFRLMENGSVKRSVVGSYNVIGKNSKVSNSVLMERVTIGEHVKIENCIICNDVKIFDRVELKDCEIESGTVIESNFIGKGEKIAKC